MSGSERRTPWRRPADASNVLVGPGVISTTTMPTANNAIADTENMEKAQCWKQCAFLSQKRIRPANRLYRDNRPQSSRVKRRAARVRSVLQLRSQFAGGFEQAFVTGTRMLGQVGIADERA